MCPRALSCFFAISLVAAAPSARGQLLQVEGPAAVLCDPGDPYYPLALEISRTEALPVYHSAPRALSAEPRFLLWVGAPALLDDAVLAGFGRAVADRLPGPAVGIITGKEIQEARALWRRAAHARGERVYAVNGEYPPARVFQGQVLALTGDTTARLPLTKPGLISILKDADYLTFTGHGGPTWWRLGAGLVFRSADVPPELPPIVVATASCQALRPAEESSMALEFAQRGAAAYAGFLFSPIEGYLIGGFSGAPFRYTSPDFTAGQVVLLQNAGALRAFASVPFYFLLGDPRMALQAKPVFGILRIDSSRGMRRLDYGELPRGIIPLRIKDGARFHFVELPDSASTADGDIFFNARLQTLNIGADKLILVDHPGGELSISLHPDPPWHRIVTDPILDSLDHTLLYLPGTGGAFLYLMVALAPLPWVALLLWRRRATRQLLMAALLVGIAMGLAMILYASARADQATITSKPIGLGTAPIVAAVLLPCCGAIAYYRAASVFGRLAALALAVFPSLGATAVNFAVVMASNMFMRAKVGAGVYGYGLAWMALIGLTIHAGVFIVLALLFRLGLRRAPRIASPRRHGDHGGASSNQQDASSPCFP